MIQFYTIDEFIKTYYLPAQNYKAKYNYAYTMKHRYEDITGIYMTEEEFVKQMLENGYQPDKSNHFKLRQNKACFMAIKDKIKLINII